MGRYEVMQICLNGHQITSHYNKAPEFRQDFCDKCGKRNIHTCPNCGEPIRGKYISNGILDLTSILVPSNCHKCGTKYPWAKKLNTAIKLPRIHLPAWLTRNTEKIAVGVLIAVILAWLGLK